ncbi:DUF317 domain-containing protein [Streptomyces sp. NPDC003077]|uniref:DUF317 domain-containing protein n=1 Tax=Streptomyces sp. NPDC003077 TaxID=3154443 RepID=UPI0033BD94E0
MSDPDTIEGDVYVSPRYLAGMPGVDEVALKPFTDSNWPSQHVDDDLGRTVYVSPDSRLRVGFFGDDYDLWNIAAYADPFGPRSWAATFNQNTPPELVAGFTQALVQDYPDGNSRFLARPPLTWHDYVRPLFTAGWAHGAAERGTVEIIAPDKQAGAFIDLRRHDPDDETVTLWAGPPGWATRAEAAFTANTPAHLIAATAAAFTDSAPVARYRECLQPRLAALARLTPVQPPEPPAPTPLDVRRAAARRRPPTLGTSSVPRWSTTTLPPAPAGVRSSPRR